MTTGERIKALRIEKGVGVNEMAVKLGVSRTTIFRYENGDIEKVPITCLEIMAKVLNTSVAYLMGWSDNPARTSSDVELFGISKAEKRSFPILGNVACGEPILAEERHDLMVDADSPIDADYCLIAKGDSMINLGIKDGTIVFIKKQDSVDNGEVAVVLINDEVTLKRVFFYGDTLVLRAENSMYKEMTFKDDGATNIRILGKAVSYQNIIV